MSVCDGEGGEEEEEGRRQEAKRAAAASEHGHGVCSSNAGEVRSAGQMCGCAFPWMLVGCSAGQARGRKGMERARTCPGPG